MKKIIYLFIITIFIGSCVDEDFLNEDPRNLIAADNLLVNAAGFESAVNGLYALVLYERTDLNNGNLSNNFVRNIPMMQGLDNSWGPFWNNAQIRGHLQLDRLNSQVNDLNEIWDWLYQVVNTANTIVDRAQNTSVNWGGGSDEENNENRDKIVAEARAIRAWAYRHLTNLYNNVPLKLGESTGDDIETTFLPTPRREVEEQMEEDWLFAMKHLPESQVIPGRISSAVPMHYLAELYIIWGDYAGAESMAENVINAGPFSLVTERYGVEREQPGTPFTDMFLNGNVSRNQGNTEVLWSFQREFQIIGGEIRSNMRRGFVSFYSHSSASAYFGVSLAVTEARGGRGLGMMAPTTWAVENFGEGDDRGSQHALRQYYIVQPEDVILDGNDIEVGDTLRMDVLEERMILYTQGAWPSITKYDFALPDNLGGAESFKDEIYLRLAETYLLQAEAEIMQGKNAEAAETINVLRRRANAPDVSAADVDIDFLLDERSRELLFEEHRKYVLVRNNKYVERAGNLNPLVSDLISEDFHYLPIPQYIIDANPDYPQNGAY